MEVDGSQDSRIIEPQQENPNPYKRFSKTSVIVNYFVDWRLDLSVNFVSVIPATCVPTVSLTYMRDLQFNSGYENNNVVSLGR